MLPVILHCTGELPQKGIIQLNTDNIANIENSPPKGDNKLKYFKIDEGSSVYWG